MTSTRETSARERADLLETLRAQRSLLRFTVQGLTEEQARQRTTVSEITLGGVIKHVAHAESMWADFIESGPSAFPAPDDGEQAARWQAAWHLADGETLAEVLARYEQVAARTDALVSELPDLDADHPLPSLPWFEPGARRSARRVFVHIVAETAQHSGHADILRESLDGQKTMG